MSTLPLTFSAAPLPLNIAYTPQEFADALVARLRVESDANYSIFVSGSVAPTSNMGPWLKDGTTWYVWDTISGQYVPQVLTYESLKYVPSTGVPDNTKFTFWIELNGSGKAIAIKYYSGGAWKDVYEDKFAAVDAKFLLYPTFANVAADINVAVGGLRTELDQVPFRAQKVGAAQAYTAGSGDEQITFEVENFDKGGYFLNSQFTVPTNGIYEFKASAYVSITTGTPTGIDRQIKLRVNGTVYTRKNIQVNDLTGGQTLDISDSYQLTAGQIVDVVINITSTGASTWEVLNDSTNTFFMGKRISNG